MRHPRDDAQHAFNVMSSVGIGENAALEVGAEMYSEGVVR